MMMMKMMMITTTIIIIIIIIIIIQVSNQMSIFEVVSSFKITTEVS